MPTLEWMGKNKVVAYHRQVPYRVLEHVPEKSVMDSHGSDCGNMVIHGDNLEALKALLPEYEGRWIASISKLSCHNGYKRAPTTI